MMKSIVSVARRIPNPELWISGLVLLAVCVAQALLS